MQKKILASLLMVPMAYSAFANIPVEVPVTPGDWTFDGVQGDVKYDEETNSFSTLNVGVGNVSQTLNLPQGKYTLNFTNTTNIAVSVNGTKLTATDGAYTFNVAADPGTTAKTTLEIAAANPAETFSFTGLALEVVCDFNAIAAELTDSLANITLDQVVEADTSAVAKSLRERYADFKALLGSFEARIDSLKDKNKQNLDTYMKEQLGDDPNAIAADMAVQKYLADQYNEAVKAENARFANEQENIANQAALAANVDALQAKLEAIKSKIEANNDTVTNYVKKATEGELNSVSASVAGLDELVEALKENPDYTGAAVIDVTGLQATAEDVAAQLDALDSEVDKAIADQNAFNAAATLNNDLKTAWKANDTKVSGLKGIENYETVPYTYTAQVQTQLAEIYNNALDSLKINISENEIQGAAAKLAADQATVEAAIEALNNLGNEAAAKVTEQNALQTANLDTIAGLKNRYTAINTVAAKFTGAQAEEVNEKLAAISEKLDSAKALTDSLYTELALTELNPEFEALLSGADEELTILEAFIQPIIDLQGKLDEAKKTISTKYTPVANKFNSTIENIQDGINAIELPADTENIDQYMTEIVAPVSDGIDQLLTNAEALYKAYDAVNAANTAYGTTLANIDNLLKTKIILEGNNFADLFKGSNADYKAFKAEVEAYQADFTAAMALESQACYDALKALADKYNSDAVIATGNAISKDIDVLGTTGNFAVVNNAVAAAEALAADSVAYMGQSDIEGAIAAIKGKIETQATAFETAKGAATYNHQNFNTIDEALKNLITEINTVKENIAKYKKYQEIYNSYDVDHLWSDLAAAEKCNEENAIEPAKTYWEGVIAADSVKIVNFQSDLDTALKAYKDAKKNIGVQDSILKEAYGTLDRTLEKLPTDIIANETAHSSLLATSKDIRDLINAGLDSINAQKEQSAAVPEIAQKLDEWTTNLEALLNSAKVPGNLASEDYKVYESFAKGNNANDKAKFDAEYDAIKAAADSIISEYNNEFGNLVADYNNSLIANGTAWDAALKLLDLDYQKAITTYNKYMYGLHNEGYKAFIEGTLKDHRKIYNYIDSINNLQAAVRAYVAEQNAAKHIITAAEWQANATDKADAIEGRMATDVATMQSAVDAKAKEYFAQQDPAAFAALAAATTKLEEVGISEDLIEKYLGANLSAHLQAKALYNKTNIANVLGQMGLEMDNIADLLDEAMNIKPAMFDQAAAEQWTNDIADAEQQLAILEARIVASAFATDSVLAQQKAIFDAAKSAILDTLKPETANYNTLTGLEDDLQEQLGKAKEAADAIKASSDNNKANQDAYNKYIADIAELTNDLDALKAFVNGLAAGTDATLAAPEAALEALKNYVENNKNALVENKTNVENLVNAFNTAVENAYGTTATAEQALLNEWYGKLKAAYNDANVNSTTLSDEEKAAYKADVDSIELPAVWTPTTDNTEWMADAVATEKAISTLYNELQGSWTVDKNGNDNPSQNPLVEALTKVNEAADQAGINLNEFETALNGYEDDVKAAYTDQLLDYINEYQSLQGAVAAQGANIILTADRYINDYNELAEAIKATADKAAEAQQAALDKAAQEAASDAAYAKLLEEYNDLEDAFDALKQTVAGYGEDVETAMEATLDGIEAQLEAAKEALEAAKEAYSLTDESTLENAEAIENAIKAAGKTAAKAYAAGAYDDAVAAKQAYLEAMTTLNVVDEIAKELATEYHNVNQDLSNALGAFNELDTVASATAADYLNIHALYGEIEAAFEAMLKKAQDNVFVKGDVNLNPDGEINGNDVQLLIKWVGEGMTYAELYEISPVAAAAADLNGDKVLNIADITAEINLVMNADYAEAPAVLSRHIAPDNGTIALSLISSENGISRYALNINSARKFVAGQFDIKGGEIVGAELAGMSHDLYQFDNSNATRFIIASFDNAALATENAVMIIEVKGDANLVIEGATFADENAAAYALKDASANGINGINAASTVTDRIYNAAGQTMRAIQRGINIIRHSDGTTTKELHK